MKNSIKIQRAIKGLTQAGLAEKVNVTRQTVNAIELEKYSPSAVLALKLALVLDIKVDELFQLEKRDWN
ncbi:helix-turn-helix transcriptional regulator [Mesonia sp. K4-1]|mgnify:CR=1 FL=1|jgi:putative transcriptional regulator|uniref:helix-turn-helix transcriptional regulator n=1 Tax=Mesonia sp. K4-1 TaxID=2602760 RepID=UPI0011CA7ECD|nr:helix-turn-helix domain-containing protein [Mesonia sp. K4-1]TXK73090.1 helix-turn-helix domain-containing protein [Mesonia sp. K4-1]